MPAFEIVGQSQKDADFNAVSTSRLVNCYREPVEGGHAIKSVPGTSLFADIEAVFMYALEEIGGYIYAAAGGGLYRVESDATVTILGAITNDKATMSGNNGSIAVAAGGVYYVWDGATLSMPVGGAFSNVGAVEFLNQATIMTERNGRRFQWSDPAAPETLNGLNFATAEGRDDNILRPAVINGNLWLLKTKSMEIWYDTGSGYSRVSGGVLDTGLKAFGLVAKFDDGAMIVGDDNIAYIASGSGMRPISIPAVETDIARGVPSRCFYYEDEGHKFCTIQFADRPAWIYDLSTGEWHNRTTGIEDDAWLAVAAVKAWNVWHVGIDTGEILRLGRTSADHDATLVRRIVTRTYRPGGFFTVKRLELFGRFGEASAASVSVRLSRDNGKTWGAEMVRNFGDVGKYAHRALWQGLGRQRQLTLDIRMTDPVETPISSMAQLEIV